MPTDTEEAVLKALDDIQDAIYKAMPGVITWAECRDAAIAVLELYVKGAK
jgi:hypothetical protein